MRIMWLIHMIFDVGLEINRSGSTGEAAFEDNFGHLHGDGGGDLADAFEVRINSPEGEITCGDKTG
jgi:hypothetical protein